MSRQASDRAERRQKQTQQRAANILRSMTNAATTVVLVRHGETDWNVEHRLQGQLLPGPPLNENGRRQAQVVAERLATMQIEALYSSDLLRAMQSARVIAALTGLQIHKDSQLREKHLGELQGLTLAEASPEAAAALRNHARDVRPLGGGESLDDMLLRARTALTRIVAAHPGQKIVIVSHGGFLHACYRRATGADFPGAITNSSVNIMKVEGDKCALVSWADIEHLSGIGCQVDGFGGGQSEA